MKTRLIYAIAALALFGIEAAIALFVTQPFVRGHLGDVLVVILIHCMVRVIFPGKPRLLALYVLLTSLTPLFAKIILSWKLV